MLELAEEYVNSTNRNIFLTGKAGTGKTTFLRNLVRTSPKRKIVVAPTGVAALNAEGVTIHSMFQLPFGVTPGGKNAEMAAKGFMGRYKKNKLKLLRSLDLLIIDEVSMVRADLLDAIDYTLKRIRRSSQPFGGVQVLLIGDMNQLPPVARDEDWAILRDYYESVYFFDSLIYKSSDFITIELDKIFRQSDQEFIDLLAKVRDKKLDVEGIQMLNERYDADFCRSSEAENWINLCTHNSMADNLNRERLAAIEEDEFEYEAVVQGDFPEAMYPCESILTLKVGSRVMFTKNDGESPRRYVNGTLGRVVSLSDDSIHVELDDNGDIVDVTRADWENTRYKINKETQDIDQEVIGLFTQFPLRLAWAITIHKSQGLTFDKVIIDAADSFAHGQVYVALSRCRSLQGIVLSSKIRSSAIKHDYHIDVFNQGVQEDAPDTDMLESDKRQYKEDVLVDIFSFGQLSRLYLRLYETQEETVKKYFPSFHAALEVGYGDFLKDVYNVSLSFEKQLRRFMREENAELGDRILKGCEYFKAKLEETVWPYILKADDVFFDNDEIAESFDYSFTRLFDEYFLKLKMLEYIALRGFSVPEYLDFKNRVMVQLEDMTPSKYISKHTPKPAETSDEEKEDIQNPALFAALKAWRLSVAKAIEKPAYVVLPQKPLISIANKKPQNLLELNRIDGIGPKRLDAYGDAILEIVAKF